MSCVVLLFGHGTSCLLSPVEGCVLCGFVAVSWQKLPSVPIGVWVPMGPPSCGGDVIVYVFDINQTELAHSLLFCSCVCFCLYCPFNCISFLKFSQRLCFLTPFFWSYFCLIGPFNYISLYESLLQPCFNPLWLTGLKASTN